MKLLSVLTLGAFALSGCFVNTVPANGGGPYGGQPGYNNQPPYQPQPQPYPQPTGSPDYTPPPDYVGAGGNPSGAKNPRLPRVMIVIPEFHITRERVPDPAAETEFLKTFKLAGYKLIDKKQAEKVWKDDVLFLLEKEEDVQAAAALAFKIGADILIMGEAFSEKGTEMHSGYGGVPGQIVTANARVEIKAIKAATAEILWADSEHARAADTTEIIAGKKALAEAGQKLSVRVSDILMKQWHEGDAGYGANAIELVLSFPTGKLTPSEVKAFKEGAMRSIAGLQEIVDREFATGGAQLEFIYEGDANGLAEAIDGKKIGKRTCSVTKINDGKIFVSIK